MKYNVTYHCGHEGVEFLYGNEEERQRMLWWYKTTAVCPECYKKQKKEEEEAKRQAELYEFETNEEKRERINKELGLPDLIGSDSQKIIAENIRFQIANNIHEYRDKEKKPEDYDLALDMMTTVKYAYWYIENRDLRTILHAYINSKFFSGIVLTQEEKKLVSEAEEESTVYPHEKNKIKGDKVHIDFTNEYVSLKYKYDEDFIKLMRDLHCKWDKEKKEWRYPLNELSGEPVDRAVELACMVLDEGWVVLSYTVPVEWIRYRVWEPMHNLWIDYRGRSRAFIFIVQNGDIEVKKEIKKHLKVCYYKDFELMIKSIYFREVYEIAQIMHFHFTKKAQKKIDELRLWDSLEEQAIDK